LIELESKRLGIEGYRTLNVGQHISDGCHLFSFDQTFRGQSSTALGTELNTLR